MVDTTGNPVPTSSWKHDLYSRFIHGKRYCVAIHWKGYPKVLHVFTISHVEAHGKKNRAWIISYYIRDEPNTIFILAFLFVLY